MRIIYLNPNGTIGGAEASLLHLWAVLRKTKPAWRLSLIAGADGPLLSKAAALGLTVKVIPFPPALQEFGDFGVRSVVNSGYFPSSIFTGAGSAAMRAPAYLLRLQQAIREFRPDLIHSNGIKMHLLSACGPLRRVPIVWHVHEYVRRRPVTARLLQLCAWRCSAMVANSESVAEDVQSLCGSEPTVQPIHNGIDTDEFAPDGPSMDLDKLSHLPPAPAGTIRVGLVAIFARWKGHEVFLRSLAKLGSQLPIRGYIVGGPIYQTQGSQHTLANLQELAQTLGLAGRVGFTGYIDNPAAVMRSLDIVVHASTEPEPFGLVIVEAMACGKAIVVSECGGVSEIVQDHVNALTHKPGDSTALADRIRELAMAPDLRARLGETARSTAKQRFGRERFADQFVKIYTRLAGVPI